MVYMGILSILHLPLATIRSLDKSYCHTFCPHFGWSQWNQLKPKSGWSLAPEEEERQRMEAARITELPRIFMPKWSKCIQMQLIGLGLPCFTHCWMARNLIFGLLFDQKIAHNFVLLQSGSPDVVEVELRQRIEQEMCQPSVTQTSINDESPSS
jgi:hypothetical protein